MQEQADRIEELRFVLDQHFARLRDLERALATLSPSDLFNRITLEREIDSLRVLIDELERAIQEAKRRYQELRNDFELSLCDW